MSHYPYVVGKHTTPGPLGDARPANRSRPVLALLLAIVAGVVLADVVVAQERYSPATRGVRDVIADRAEAHGVSVWALTALAECESQFNPEAVGDTGTSLGLLQLNTLPTGLYWHFLAVGYDDWRSATQQADYVARVLAGEWARDGVTARRWSCWRIVRGGGW